MLPVALSLGVVPFRSLPFFLLPFFPLQSVVPPNCRRSTEVPLGLSCRSVEIERHGEIAGTFPFVLWHLENCHKTDQICSVQCCHSWDRMIYNLVNPRPNQWCISEHSRSLRSREGGYRNGQSPPCRLSALCTASDLSASLMMRSFLAFVQLTNIYWAVTPLGSSFQHLRPVPSPGMGPLKPSHSKKEIWLINPSRENLTFSQMIVKRSLN